MSLYTPARQSSYTPWIDVSIPTRGPLLTELTHGYLTLHPRRLRWSTHEKTTIQARVEISLSNPAALRRQKPRSASVRVFIEHAGGQHGPAYTEASPFLLAEGEHLLSPHFLQAFPCLALHVQTRLQALEEMAWSDAPELICKVA